MEINKSKLGKPDNTKENRERLAETIVNDLSTKELRQRVKVQLIQLYKVSTVNFLKEYWTYFEETGGHCPFNINSG